MAQTKYTRKEIVDFIRELDTRAKTLSDAKIDNIINRGYAELMASSDQLFSNEEVVALDDYYDAGESNITLDVDEDATDIYDLYFTADKNNTICQTILQGVGIYRNSEMIYRDNRVAGRFHLRLDEIKEPMENAVVKYYYTPKATDEEVYMESQVYLTFQDAIWTALNYFLKDIDGEMQKLASLRRTSRSMTQEPEDVQEEKRSIFGTMGL